MTEPDIALTDFALAVECCVLAFRFSRVRVPDPHQRQGARLLFAAAAVATLCGGVYHGFLLDAAPRVQNGLWLVIFAAAGAASFGCWVIATAALLPARAARAANLVGVLLFLVYLVSALARIQSFASLLVATSIAAGLLLAAFVTAYLRRRRPRALLGVAALLLVLCGSLIQRSGFDLHPRFTHNALYHVVLGVALLLLAAGVPALGAPNVPERVDRDERFS